MDRITSETNPLLDFSGLPRFREIRAEHVAPALDQLLAKNRARREVLLQAPGERTLLFFYLTSEVKMKFVLFLVNYP